MMLSNCSSSSCRSFHRPQQQPFGSARPTGIKNGSSSASAGVVQSSRRGPIPTYAAMVESISYDQFGTITFDAVAMPGAESAEILEGYTLRPGQVPAAAPTSTLPTRPDSLKSSSKPVVLVRDTNCWCPFCERVWLALEEKGIPYDCVLIELYNKPEWYKELVPTSLVPAVSFSEDGSIVWESKDILLDLERRFPQATPLLPTSQEEQAAALEFLSELEEAGLDKHGYAFMTGGRMMGRNAGADSPPPDMAALEKSFMAALQWFEGTALTRHASGPYLLGDSFSLLDIMTISSMERLAAGLPKFRGFDLRSNPDFPNTAAWFAAISARPAYQKVCSDDQTLQLLFQRMMGMTAGAAAASSKSAAAAAAAAIAAFAQAGSSGEHEALSAEQEQKARTEAYDKLLVCAADVVRHILAHSGVTRYQSSPYGSTTQSVNGHQPRIALPVREAVEQQVVRIMKALLLGSPGSKPNTSIAAAFGAVAATFLRSRWSEVPALAELSPAAIEQLQAACTQAVTQSYADGVDALVFVPPQRDNPDASPEEAAAAQAAAEAAVKIQKNKAAIVEDILLKSGLARPGTSTYGSTYMAVNGHKPVISAAVAHAVEVYALDRLCSMLLTGDAGPKPEEPEAAAVSAAALAFFRNRASAPRDMSAAATVQFRAACDAVLAQVY